MMAIFVLPTRKVFVPVKVKGDEFGAVMRVKPGVISTACPGMGAKLVSNIGGLGGAIARD